VGFETATLAFEDPYALTQRDESSDAEERWITFGAIGQGAILVVVHTCFEAEGEDVDPDYFRASRGVARKENL
jgi:uncharacterized DUF497 family protein